MPRSLTMVQWRVPLAQAMLSQTSLSHTEDLGLLRDLPRGRPNVLPRMKSCPGCVHNLAILLRVAAICLYICAQYLTPFWNVFDARQVPMMSLW